MKYYTADRETGTIIDEFATIEAARVAIKGYEEADKAEGTYEDGFYDIVNEDHISITAVTRAWKVYGIDGHRQRESFFPSHVSDFSKDGDIRIIELENSDNTGTNDYSIIRITRNTADECERELHGQLSDGVFENSRYGIVTEI